MGAGTSSPAAGMLGLGAFVTRTGMTPAGMGADLSGMAEGIAGTLALTARDQEDERRRKIERIVDMMGRRWGRVSPDGVERCARRVGFEYVWDTEAGSDTKKRTLSIAGQGVLIDVEFMSEQVQHVGLSFPTGGEEAMRAAPEGAEVLKRDLQGPGKGYVLLDRFVTNLERLATMDRLGVGGVSSFDAVDGIGACLRGLFGWEMQKLQKERSGQNDDDNALDVETAVMCTGSGKPQMHSRGRMGLSLQYWRERRFLGRPHRAEMEMDVDGGGPSLTSRRKREPVVYSALIDCEACSSDIYPPIRVSSAWLSDAVGKPPEELDAFSGLLGEHTIDWQEPLPAWILSEGDANPNANTNPTTVDQMSIDGVTLISTGKPPNVRFVARLDPPVIVPLQVALVIYDSVGAPIAQESLAPTTFEALLFPSANSISTATIRTTTNPSSLSTNLTPPSSSSTTTQTQQSSHITMQQTINTYDANGHRVPLKHKYTLFNPTQSLAHAIENIPFSHPREIIAMLPYLRQWALLGSILRRSFIPTPIPISHPSASLLPSGLLSQHPKPLSQEDQLQEQESHTPSNSTSTNQTTTTPTSTLDEELAAFLFPRTKSRTSDTMAEKKEPPQPLAVDISFTHAPPRLTCVFELEGQLRSLVFGFNVNGEVVVLGSGTGVGIGGGGGGGGGAGVALGGGVGLGGRFGLGGVVGSSATGTDTPKGAERDKDEEDDEKKEKEKEQIEKIQKVLQITESIGAVVAWLQRSSPQASSVER